MRNSGWAEWIAEKGLNVDNFKVKHQQSVKSLTKPWLSPSLRLWTRLLPAEVNPELTFFPRITRVNVCFCKQKSHIWVWCSAQNTCDKKIGTIQKENRPTKAGKVWILRGEKSSYFCSNIQLKIVAPTSWTMIHLLNVQTSDICPLVGPERMIDVISTISNLHQTTP